MKNTFLLILLNLCLSLYNQKANAQADYSSATDSSYIAYVLKHNWELIETSGPINIEEVYPIYDAASLKDLESKDAYLIKASSFVAKHLELPQESGILIFSSPTFYINMEEGIIRVERKVPTYIGGQVNRYVLSQYTYKIINY